jgi:hypothetical protein
MKSFRGKIAIVIVLSAIVALCAILDWRPGDTDWEVARSIGTFGTRDAAVSASLKRLSRALDHHPATAHYRIYFDLTGRDEHGGGGATYYVRKFKQIGFENDPGSGFVVYWTNVGDAAIHAAATTNGTFNSFGKEAWRSVSYAP